MRKAFFICFGIFTLVCCETEMVAEEKIVVSWSGATGKNAILKLDKGFYLDSIQFADGLYKYLLTGAIFLGKEKNTFSLMIRNHPLRLGQNVVERNNFPLRKYDSTEYSCCISKEDGGCSIEWTNDNDKLMIFADENTISGR